MDIDIYIDVVFFINFSMDVFVFWIAGRLSGMKAQVLRLVLGGAVSAALYCCLALLPPLSTYYNFFTTLAVLMIGLLISYRPNTFGAMLKLVIYSNISAFAVGGAVIGMFYYTNFGDILGNALSLTVSGLPVKILLTTSAASYVVIKLFIIRLNKVTVKKQTFYNIRIFVEEKEIALTALLDTGNSLLDPLTNEPVIIAEFSGLEKILPTDVIPLFHSHKEDELLELLTAFSKTPFFKRVRIIPFSSLGKQNGMLIGIRPDIVQIISQESDNVTTKEAIVGIYNYSLSQDGSFQALLNPSML